jgi:ABC-type sugar transport system ATPase subunit
MYIHYLTLTQEFVVHYFIDTATMASNRQIYIIGDGESQQSDSPSNAENSSDQRQCLESVESPPNIDHYRNTITNNSGISMRPSITHLLNGTPDHVVALQLGDSKVSYLFSYDDMSLQCQGRGVFGSRVTTRGNA